MKMFFLQDKYRLEHLKQVLKTNNVYPAAQLVPKLEEEWCSFHNLSQSSLHQVSETCMYLRYFVRICILLVFFCFK